MSPKPGENRCRLVASLRRHLASTAIALGVLSVTVALLITWSVYRRVEYAAASQQRASFLNEARLLAASAATHADEPNTAALLSITQLWEQMQPQPADKYICVVDGASVCILHSEHPELIGIDAGANPLLDTHGSRLGTVGDLAARRGAFVGGYLSTNGQRQLAAFVPVPGRPWLLGVHRSQDAAAATIQAQTRPLLLGLAAVAGLLIPLSMALCYASLRLTRSRAQHAFQRLAISEAQLRRMIESARDIVVLHDLDGRYLYYSGPKAFGVSPDEVVGRRLDEMFSTEEARVLLGQIRHVAETGTSTQIENQVTWQGESLFFLDDVFPVTDDDGITVSVAKICRNITERKRAEMALIDSERRLRQIIKSTAAGYVRLDNQGRIQEVNDAWLRMHGYTRRDEIIGCHISVTHRPADQQAGLQLVDRLLAGETIPSGEFARQRTDGTVGFHSFTANPVYHAGKIVGIEAFLIDLTKERQAEAALRAAEAKYRALGEQSLQGVVIFRSNEVLFANAPAAEILGIPLPEVLKRSPRTLPIVAAAGPTAANGQFDNTRVPTTATSRYEFCVSRPDGGVRWVELFATNIDYGGTPAIQTTFVDITERKRIESRLREREQVLRHLAENVDEVFWVADADGSTFHFLSPVVERVWGIPADVARRSPAVLKTAICAEDRTLASRIFESGAGHQQIFRIQRPDGSRRWVRARTFPVRDEAGEVFRIVGIAEDVTERRHAEEQLRRYREHLEEIVAERTAELHRSQEQLLQAERLASIGTLATGIAHEINNPIGGILLAAENATAARKKQLDSTLLDDCLNDIVSHAKRCGRIIRTVLDFAQRQPTCKAPEDLNALVRRSLMLVSELVRKHDARVQTTLADGLDPVHVNALEIEQVIVNLLHNAIEAGPHRTSLDIRTEARNDSLQLTIRDDGPGIPTEHIKHLFDPFFTTRRERGGTGLGLSIAHSIITEHDGTIQVRSELGEGSEFIISLPRAGAKKELVTHGANTDCG